MAQVKTPTWATCPQSVCKKHGVMGCERRLGRGLGVEVVRGRYSQTQCARGTNWHHERMRRDASRSSWGGSCSTTVSVEEKLLPACDGNQVTQCRFCSAAKKASAAEHDVADVPGRGLRQMGYQNGSLRNAAGDVPVADEKNGKRIERRTSSRNRGWTT